MDVAKLSRVTPPWLHLLAWDELDNKLSPAEIYCHMPDCALRILRGQKMTSRADFMREIGAALQFPDYFGENWDAVSDLLTELNSLIPAKSYILYFNHIELVLNSDPESLHLLLDVLSEASCYWSQANPSIPFHVLFKCPKEDLREVSIRLREAAAGKIQIAGLI